MKQGFTNFPDIDTPTAKQPLEVSKLKSGDIYLCRLSGQKILVKEVTRGGTQTADGIAGGITEVLGMYFNAASGKYDWVAIEDFQMTEL